MLEWRPTGRRFILAKRVALCALLLVIPAFGQSNSRHHGPDWSGNWPTDMAFVQLKNAGLADNGSFDFRRTKTIRLASEKVGSNLWHQVYRITFVKKSGEMLDAIAISDASREECSMSGVEVF